MRASLVKEVGTFACSSNITDFIVEGITTNNIVALGITKVAVVKDGTIVTKAKLLWTSPVMGPPRKTPETPEAHNIFTDTSVMLEAGALTLTDNMKYPDVTAIEPEKHGIAIADIGTRTARAAGDPVRSNAGHEMMAS